MDWTTFSTKHAELLDYVHYWNAHWDRYNDAVKQMKLECASGSCEECVLYCLWATTGNEFRGLCERYLAYMHNRHVADEEFGDMVSVLCFNGMSHRLNSIHQLNRLLSHNRRWRYVREMVKQSLPNLM